MSNTVYIYCLYILGVAAAGVIVSGFVRRMREIGVRQSLTTKWLIILLLLGSWITFFVTLLEMFTSNNTHHND